MFEFTSCIGFRVNVGDFFQLQRAFHTQSVIQSSADIQQAVCGNQRRGDELGLFLVLEDFWNVIRCLLQFCNEFPAFDFINCTSCQSKFKCQQIHDSNLNHVSLGRCNGNFWACMCVNQHIGFPCNRAALCVDNGERFCSPIFCQPHRCQAVGSFARLGNDNHQILCTENRVPIPEFGSNVNSNGNPCQLFNDILPNNTSVHGSTAGNNKNPVILFQSLRRNVAFFQVRQTVPNPRSNRCFDCSGLFVDFF